MRAKRCADAEKHWSITPTTMHPAAAWLRAEAGSVRIRHRSSEKSVGWAAHECRHAPKFPTLPADHALISCYCPRFLRLGALALKQVREQTAWSRAGTESDQPRMDADEHG